MNPVQFENQERTYEKASNLGAPSRSTLLRVVLKIGVPERYAVPFLVAVAIVCVVVAIFLIRSSFSNPRPYVPPRGEYTFIPS